VNIAKKKNQTNKNKKRRELISRYTQYLKNPKRKPVWSTSDFSAKSFLH
jgi:ribosome-binding protein aMBF1 (putative translation factor)